MTTFDGVIVSDCRGWGINTRSGGKTDYSFLGKYWWFENTPPYLPKHMEGYRTAVFRTRREALGVLPRVRKTYPKARVERVSVTVWV